MIPSKTVLSLPIDDDGLGVGEVHLKMTERMM